MTPRSPYLPGLTQADISKLIPDLDLRMRLIQAGNQKKTERIDALTLEARNRFPHLYGNGEAE